MRNLKNKAGCLWIVIIILLMILLFSTYGCTSEFDFDEKPKTDLRAYDTITHIDTLNLTFNDTLNVFDTIYHQQKVNVYDTIKISVYDTIKVEDIVKVYDTITRITDIKVYDTIYKEQIVNVYDTITRKIYVRYYATSEIQEKAGWFNIELKDKEHIKFYDDSGTIMQIQEIILELK